MHHRYGKPQVVACNFQSWLLGTGAILLLAYVSLSLSLSLSLSVG